MLTNFGSGDFGVGNNFAKIDLGDTLAGTVHVWTQTPEYYQGNEPFDAVLGILNNDTGMLVESNNDADPTTGYSSQAINDLITANTSTRSSNAYDAFLSFSATSGTDYSVIVGDLNQSNSSTQFGGLFDLYAVTGIGSRAETLLSKRD